MAEWKKVLVSGSTIDVAALQLASTAVTSTAAELNLIDGSSAGTIVNSKAVIYGSGGEVNGTKLQIAGSDITAVFSTDIGYPLAADDEIILVGKFE